MHSPKSSLESRPSLASELNLDSTRFHISSASLAPVVLLMNLRPLRARCALDFVRSSFAFSLRASRAEMMSSSVSDEAMEDVDLSHENFRRRVREVFDKVLLKIPTPEGEEEVPPLAPSLGLEVGVAVVGATLQTTMESFSSSSVTSTRSC